MMATAITPTLYQLHYTPRAPAPRPLPTLPVFFTKIAIRVGIERMFVPYSLLPVPCSLFPLLYEMHPIASSYL
ncbi:MAG: hypothetical protein F6K26_19995 [Moorea sp. SIO2I5]|nr:hypothetical protein [Moorena sp. SIO2I5]